METRSRCRGIRVHDPVETLFTIAWNTQSRGKSYLPADPKTIRAFIEDQAKAGKKAATIKRYVATIAD
jgi:hypothetical protein